MSLAAQLAWAELRQQLRGHVFRIVVAVSLLMVVGAAAIDALRLDAASRLGSGPGLILQVHLLWTLFYLFTAAAFIGDAATRDEASGFAPLVRATPTPQSLTRGARFAGAFAAVVLCFLSVPAGLLAARWLPAADPAWVAPVLPATYAFALFVLSLPNLFLASALFLLLANVTRSMAGCLIGAVALLVPYGLARNGGSSVPALLEPFGFAALAQGSGPLFANRLLWLAIGVALLAAGLHLAGRERRHVQRRPTGVAEAGSPPPASAVTIKRSFGPPAALRQLLARIRHHLRETLFTPVFAVLLLLGCASAAASLRRAVQTGAPTRELLATLIGSFELVPIVVALFFAGELQWSDRGHRIAAIVNSTPTPPAVLTLARFAALAAMLAALALATAAVLAVLLMLKGRAPDFGLLLSAYVLPKSYDWILFGILALFLQTLAPNKLAGWGLLVLFLIARLGLRQAGLDDPLWVYGSYPAAPLPPALSGASGAMPYRLLWGAVATLLVLFSVVRSGHRR